MNNNIGRPNSLGPSLRLHDPVYIPSRTLTVVDVYEQYQYVHKSSRQTSQCV